MGDVNVPAVNVPAVNVPAVNVPAVNVPAVNVPEENVLELRIHGVNNTTPADMLDLPQEAIEQLQGDALGSFWRPKPEALGALTPKDRGYVPPGISREAYSWGGMARSSIGGASAIGKVVGAAARVGWSLLLPFGLVNVAYWSRKLADNPAEDDLATAPMQALTSASRGGAAALRFAGLLLTLMTATTASVVALDFLAVQCYSDTVHRCESLPTQLGFLYGWSLSQRLALLGFAPLVLIGFLWYLSAVSRLHYETATRDQNPRGGDDMGRTPDASRAVPRWPLLRTPGFWNHSVITSATGRLHLAAVAAMLAVATGWHMRFGGGDSCRSLASLADQACVAQVGSQSNSGGQLWVILAGVVLLVADVIVLVTRSDDAADILRADHAPGANAKPEGLAGLWRSVLTLLHSPMVLGAVVWGSGLLFLAQAGSLWLADLPARAPDAAALTGPVRTEMIGISATPSILAAVVLGVSLSALTWRYVQAWWPLVLGFVFAAALLLSGMGSGPQAGGWPLAFRAVAALAAASLLAQIFFRARGQDGPARRYQIWGGCGPGVALLLAQLLCMTIGSAVVVAVGNVLNGSYSAASLAGVDENRTAQLPCTQPCDTADPYLLTAPRPYVWFGAALVLVLVVVVLVVLVAMVLQWRSGWQPSRQLARQSGHPGRGVGQGVGQDVQGVGQGVQGVGQEASWAVASPTGPGPVLRGGRPLDPLPAEGPLSASVRSARALARHAHRAEKATGLLAYVGAAGLAGALSVSISGWHGAGYTGLVGELIGAGMWALAGVGGLVVGLAAGGSAGPGRRPLGLMWDLICFLPRAGHPFGPPCYAERVVPELLGRYHWWLTQEGARAEDAIASSPRRVVLSAHSLGSVLAVATILGAPDATEQSSPLPKISMLSYGSQLRAYFSRFFPELLGPAVLGSPPCRAASGTTADPWEADRTDTQKPALVVHAHSVRGLLGGSKDAAGRWLNLWRLTDYLGFPVHHYPVGVPPAPAPVSARPVPLPPAPVPSAPFPSTPTPSAAVQSASDPPTPTPSAAVPSAPAPPVPHPAAPVPSAPAPPAAAPPGQAATQPEAEVFDRYAEEVDHTSYLLGVLTHGDYPRTQAYQRALLDLADVGPANPGG